MSESIPYSYHTFIYPFLYDTSSHPTTYEDFCDQISKVGIWMDDNIIDTNGDMRHPSCEIRQRWDYQTYVYFNHATRNTLMTDGGISRSYCISSEIENGEEYDGDIGEYNIALTGGVEFKLSINNIRLKVFNTGIALMVFELEYYPDKYLDNKKKIENVEKINEYGRRMYLEFLPSQNGGKILAAESIKISVKNKKYTYNLREYANKSYDEIRQSVKSIPVLIPHLLAGIDDEIEKYSENNFFEKVEPAIDDRMFVCCCIVDQKCSDMIQGYSQCEQQNDYTFEHNTDEAKKLYALLNIDDVWSSCQNKHDVQSYLSDQIYGRWMDYGTMHAVTNHSLVCITSPEVIDSVVNPFLFLYVMMCELVIVQRATLIRVDAKITESIPECGKGNWERITEIEKDFARFQGEIMLNEVTSQIQGIELYQKIQKALFIENLETNLQRQLGNIYQISESEVEGESQKKQKKIESLVSFISLLTSSEILIKLIKFYRSKNFKTDGIQIIKEKLIGFAPKLFDKFADAYREVYPWLLLIFIVVVAIILAIVFLETLKSSVNLFKHRKK